GGGKALGQAAGTVGVGTGSDDDELGRAEPAEDVGRAGRAAQRGGGGLCRFRQLGLGDVGARRLLDGSHETCERAAVPSRLGGLFVDAAQHAAHVVEVGLGIDEAAL